jgi:hypothetical protein
LLAVKQNQQGQQNNQAFAGVPEPLRGELLQEFDGLQTVQ